MLYCLVMPLLMMLCVTTVASENQESCTGDCGELILECVVKNVPQSLFYSDLCILLGTNKTVKKTLLPCKTERLKLVQDELIQRVMTKHTYISADDILVSPQFPAAGYAYEVSYTPYFECLRMNSKGEFENHAVSLASKPGTMYQNCAKKAYYMNDTFCFVYQYHERASKCAYMVPRVVYIQYSEQF